MDDEHRGTEQSESAEELDRAIGDVAPEFRDAIFGSGEPRDIRTDPAELRLNRFGPEDWDVLEEALDDMPITTRMIVLDEEFDRIDYEARCRAEWIAERSAKPKTERERWTGILYAHRARAQKAMVRSELAIDDWLRVLAAASFRCVYCDDDGVTIDHVVPISAGGSDTPDNVVPACKSCNSAKGPKELSVWCSRAGRDFAATVNRINEVHIKAGFLST